MKNFTGTDFRNAFQNDEGEYFRTWAFRNDKDELRYCLCLDGFRLGKNSCPWVKGGEELESLTDAINLADSLTTYDWKKKTWKAKK